MINFFKKTIKEFTILICLSGTFFHALAQSPNIILIMTDDQGWYDIGFNGNAEIKTPNLDMLAKNGIILHRFYSASAVCSPTRASVLTGRNPLRMNIPNANTGHMLGEEITLPEILQERGYTTGHFGKWHLGTLTKLEIDANRGGRDEYIGDYSIPTMHGYDEYFCTESKVPTYDPMIYPAYFNKGESKRFGWRAIETNDSIRRYGTSYWSGVEQKENDNLNGDDSKVIMDRVIPFIQKAIEGNKPFFATIWPHTPHLPVVSDSVHRNHYRNMELQKQIYYGTITAMDEQIGALWSKLEELNIQDDTIIWFCSDNGPERDTPGSANEFRARKRSLYEGGVRVPAFVIWKNHLKGGITSDFPSVTSDYMPTILDILNINYPDNRPLDGVSLWEEIQDKNSKREKVIGFMYNKQISWVEHQYKLISHDDGGSFELYNLLNDRAEKNNIIKENQEIATKMKKDLIEWISSVEKSKQGLDY